MLSKNDEFEIRARLFQNETGWMAPGKDSAAAAGVDSSAEREASYRVWIKIRGDFLDKTLRAMEGLGYL